MNELIPDTSITGEVLTQECSLGYSVCSNAGVELVEDPYEADVNNTPGQLIQACPQCLEQLSLDI